VITDRRRPCGRQEARSLVFFRASVRQAGKIAAVSVRFRPLDAAPEPQLELLRVLWRMQGQGWLELTPDSVQTH
jgi:hypothetical protein